jgi:hypothetical protein
MAPLFPPIAVPTRIKRPVKTSIKRNVLNWFIFWLTLLFEAKI